MKRSLLAMIVSMLLIVLSACTFEIIDGDDDTSGGQDATSETSDESGSESADEDEADDEDSIMDLYEKAISASEDIQSAEVKANVEMLMGLDGEEMVTKSDMTMLMTMDPVTMHQKGTTSVSFGDDEDETIDTEMYLLEDEIYIYEGFTDQWIKMDDSMGEMFGEMAQADEQQDPYEQLKMFEDHVKHFTLETTSDAYILSLEVNEDSFDELLTDILEETLPEDIEGLFEDEDMFNDTDIEQLDYKITLDKQSLQIREYDMNMVMTIESEGEVVTLDQKLQSVYTKINEIDKIEVPQDVIDEASSAF